MKILMANNFLYLRGGSEKVLFEEVAVLEGAGHEVASFSARHPSNVASRFEAVFPDVPDLETLSAIEKVRYVPRLIANGAVKRSFEAVLDAFRPDIVHFHNIYGRLTPVVAEAVRERCIPAVMTAHDYKLICPSYLRLDGTVPCSACSYGSYAPALVRKCHKGSRLYSIVYALEAMVNARTGRYDGIATIVCPSRFLLESLAEKGLPRSRLRLLPNFVADGAAQVSVADPGSYVLYAGRLSREKGVGCLLRAIEGVDVQLVIAGDGPEARDLRRFADERNLSSRIRFLGHCDRAALQQVIQGALFTVTPSECFENAPMAVIEAFALGKPVVGASIGGIPELVVPGLTGALFPPGDAAALRRVLEQMLSDRTRLARMGENARTVARERFSPEVHLHGLLEIYREAAA